MKIALLFLAVTAVNGCINASLAVYRALQGAQGQYEEAVCGSHTAPGYGPYRCDCSGLVSYAWEYPAPGFVTSGMEGTQCIKLGSMNELKPGDAILKPSTHVELFVKWVAKGSTFERAGCHNTKEGCSHGTADISYYESNGYIPCRPRSTLVCPGSGPAPGPAPGPSPSGGCYTFQSGLCPGDNNCMCTHSATCKANDPLLNFTEMSLGGKAKLGACTGRCRRVIHNACPGSNSCLKDSGPC